MSYLRVLKEVYKGFVLLHPLLLCVDAQCFLSYYSTARPFVCHSYTGNSILKFICERKIRFSHMSCPRVSNEA